MKIQQTPDNPTQEPSDVVCMNTCHACYHGNMVQTGQVTLVNHNTRLSPFPLLLHTHWNTREHKLYYALL